MFPINLFVDWIEQEKKNKTKQNNNFETKLYFISIAENIMKS